jgi:hypothetical protein
MVATTEYAGRSVAEMDSGQVICTNHRILGGFFSRTILVRSPESFGSEGRSETRIWVYFAGNSTNRRVMFYLGNAVGFEMQQARPRLVA